ncbi:MAG: alpha/beta hydrolase fold domain-containing protein, partial [Planctomycetota bacterium]
MSSERLIRKGKTMNKRIVRILTLVFAIALATVILAESKAQEAEWKIGPRTLPVPVDVSDVMRESLLKTPKPDAAAQANVPKTAKEWEAWIRDRDAKTVEGARALAKAFSVTVKQDTIAGVNVYHVTSPEIDPKHKTHLFIHVHGGAYILNGGEAGTFEAVLIAAHLQMPVISIDYRMPPKHPAPAAINDVVAVWKQLLKQRPAASMAMGGTSAGAGLTMGSVHRFKELKLALPEALLLGTPGADVSKVGDSRYINEGIDRALVAWEGVIAEALIMYADEFDHKHPYVSPVYGDFENFPPSYLITGTRDLML